MTDLLCLRVLLSSRKKESACWQRQRVRSVESWTCFFRLYRSGRLIWKFTLRFLHLDSVDSSSMIICSWTNLRAASCQIAERLCFLKKDHHASFWLRNDSNQSQGLIGWVFFSCVIHASNVSLRDSLVFFFVFLLFFSTVIHIIAYFLGIAASGYFSEGSTRKPNYFDHLWNTNKKALIKSWNFSTLEGDFIWLHLLQDRNNNWALIVVNFSQLQ